ncbi:MAG TPA: hypothetical protein VKT27_12820 [Candidatus Binataceae bacterium]|nr:hypothetical protein [Candidatus Binataceae bacterium]
MMTALPGGAGSAWPPALAEKHFAGEAQCDFDTALEMVEPSGPAEATAHARNGDRVRQGWLSSVAQLIGLSRLRPPAARDRRHVAFDGYRNPLHDEKTERDRRYGTVYNVVEHANAYLVSIEMPRRIPASSLKELWGLPDEMPDYDYTITLHDRVLAVRAGVRGEAMRRLSYISASFPPDFLTRIEFERPVSSFKHRLRNKVLEIVVFKQVEGGSAVGRAARATSA